METSEDDAADGAPTSKGALPGSAIPAACAAQGRALQTATRKLSVARRTHRKRHTKTTRRKLHTARSGLSRAATNLSDCKAVAANAAKVAEAALAADE
ncbi:MAG: hypothetical protein Q7T55_16405, partial [Solirubrobacteraceae bacterium]|nr:hypothetical protein [Solirubrobacteraceae bacterium]